MTSVFGAIILFHSRNRRQIIERANDLLEDDPDESFALSWLK